MDTNESRENLEHLRRHEDMMNGQADTFARFVIPRLRKCREGTLTEMKKVLRHWNCNKNQWSDKLTK
jgi:hypothetical protein